MLVVLLPFMNEPLPASSLYRVNRTREGAFSKFVKTFLQCFWVKVWRRKVAVWMPLDNDIFAAAVSLFSLSVFLSLYLSVCLYLCLSPIPSHTMYLSQSVPAFLFPLILLSLFLSSFLVFPPLPLLYPTECHSTSTLSFPYSIPLSHSTTHPHSHIHIQSKLNT